MKERLIKFLLERPDISVSVMEGSLGLPNASIKVSKGYIAKKHLEAVRGYLEEHYGYNDSIIDLVGNKDNRGGGTQVIKKYNVGVIPGFTDGLERYQDNNGLWKRVEDYGYAKGEKKDSFKAVTGELLSDEVGDYYMTSGGFKVYSAFNPKKKVRKSKKINIKIPDVSIKRGREF